MFIFVLALIFTSSFSPATTLTCDKSTAVSKPGAFTDQPFKVDKQDFIIRKGPNFCYIDAKDGTTYFMLEACDSIVTNTDLLEVNCMQDGKKVTFGPEKLKSIRKSKLAQLDDDFCNEYLGRERPKLPNSYDDNKNPNYEPRERAHFPTQPLNGNLMIDESRVNGGKCTLKSAGKSERLECDEIYKNEKGSGNKLICVQGYRAVEMVGTLSDGTLLDVVDLLDSELNLCRINSGTITFENLPTEKLGQTDEIAIQNCKTTNAEGKDFQCKSILLKENALVCTPINSDHLPVEIRKVDLTVRLDIYSQFFDGEKISVKKIRDLMQRQIFLPKDKKRFEAEILQGEPIIRDALRKPIQQ